MSRKIFSLFILAGAVFTSAMIHGGCVPTNPYSSVVDPFEADPANAATNNNDFGRATKVPFTDDAATVDSLLTLGDVDVYNLGDFEIGDQLSVDVTIEDRVLLSASVAIFDSVGRLFHLTGEWADIASTSLADAKFPAFTPKFDFVVRQATSPLYLALASQAEPVPGPGGNYTGRSAGPYTIKMQVRRWKTGDPLPQTSPQVVALQFDNSIVDYPPSSYFGQLDDMPPITFVGLNGRVLDPAWWRSFMIMQTMIVSNGPPNSPWFNPQFWQNFLTFAGAANQAMVGQTTPQQVYGFLVNELLSAIPAASINPAGFTPGNAQWFANNGYPWLYLFALYLGPGVGGANPAPGLNIWDSVLPGAYPTTLDPKYDDVTVVTNLIKAKMQQDYVGLNIDFRAVGTDPVPTDVPVSTVYFVSNATASGLGGLASAIDMGNLDHTDFAVVWAGEIGYANASLLAAADPDGMPSMTQSLSLTGAIASHELGHILGLVHTQQDAADIMSYSDFQQTLTSTFTNTPLWTQMFPIGTQDSYLSLLLELGMAPTP